MSQSRERTTERSEESAYREYVLGVRIVECEPRDPGRERESSDSSADGDDCDERRYRFEAPRHRGETFADPEKAELYADVYFDVNGFEEAGTGDRGIPPVMYQAGRDTLAAYLYTREHVDHEWLGSYFAHRPEKVRRLIENVRSRAESIREGVRERELE